MNFIFPLIVMLVVFYVIKNRKKRESVFQKVSSELGIPSQINPGGLVDMSGTRRGRNFHIEFTPKGKNLGPIMNVGMEIEHPFRLTLKPETTFTGFASRHGVTQDLEVGDEEFDNFFEVHANESPENMRLFSDTAFRAAAMQIGSPSLIHITADEQGLVVREFVSEADFLGTYVGHLLDAMVEMGMLLTENRILGEIKPHDSDVESEDESENEISEGISAMSESSFEGDELDRPESSGTEPPDDILNGESESVSIDEPEIDVVDSRNPEPGQAPDLATLLGQVGSGTLEAETCAQRICEIGTSFIEQTVVQLGEYTFRDTAKRVLLAMDVEEAIPALISGMKQYSLAYEIKLLMRELSESGGKRLLAEIHENHDEDVMKELFEIIGELKVEGAVSAISPFLGDSSYSIRYAAENALRRLGVEYEQLNQLKQNLDRESLLYRIAEIEIAVTVFNMILHGVLPKPPASRYTEFSYQESNLL